MGNQKEPKYKFTKNIHGAGLPTDTFLEKLREEFNAQSITCTQTKEKTGEAHTTGVGMTLHGELGGGVAHSNILTNKWNPFNIICPAK